MKNRLKSLLAAGVMASVLMATPAFAENVQSGPCGNDIVTPTPAYPETMTVVGTVAYAILTFITDGEWLAVLAF